MGKAERTKSFIIEATAPLFNTKGYEGTSMADLCNATGMTKGALYGNFANKEELAAAAFRYAIRKMRIHGSKWVDLKLSYKDKLEGLLQFFARYVMDPPVKGGCPLLNTAVEADDHRRSMKKVVAAELERSVVYITRLLEQGRRAGEFRGNFSARGLAIYFFCAIEGAIMYARVSSSDEAMRTVVRNIKATLNDLT